MNPFTPPALVAEQPLVWLVSAIPEVVATLTPVFPVEGDDGLALHGHLPRAHPHVAALRANAEATVLALGPHGYISPSWLEDRTQAPSWNYAAARFAVSVRLVEAPERVAAVLTEQARRLEAGRPGAWRPEDMGPRFERLAAHVLAFEARVTDTDPRFKLGQADREDVLRQSLDALADTPLHAWMAAHNPGRGG